MVARSVTGKVSQSLGQSMVVENRPGAGGNIGTEYVAKAKPDGHTLLFVPPGPVAINQWLYKSLPYDPQRDLTPVTLAGTVPNLLVVHPSMPANTLAELIALARAKPGQLNFASAGSGSTSHLTAELLKSMAGIEMQHVPYKGMAPALNDVLAGQVQMLFDNCPTAYAQVRAGKLRALAVTGATRHRTAPEVPAVAETVPGYEASAFFGLAVPKGTPANIVERLNREVNAALKDPKVAARLADLGGVQIGGTPEDFTKLVEAETAKWEKVITVGKVTLE
jgi:tripartite-type tricarboxylate transporter receptor subunit TctC